MVKVKKKSTKKKAVKKPKATPRSSGKGTLEVSELDLVAARLEKLKRLFCKHYYYSDMTAIDLVLSVVAGNFLDSDPLWLHLISPPSGGKTELLFSVFDCPDTYFLSDFTAAALISGYKDDGNNQKDPDSEEGDGEEAKALDEDFSLLPQLDGRIVITKDFSIIHDKPAEARSQILSILRDVYDGYASRALGNSKSKGFHSRFNYLTGMTPDIETSWNLNTLGERFLMYRIVVKDRRAHARRSLRNANRTSEIRKEIQKAVKEFIAEVPSYKPKLSVAMENKILDLSDILSTCRTYVHRERNDELVCLPLPELASRVAKQLLRVGQSVALVRGKSAVTDDEFAVMKRIALDSLPTNRKHLLFALWDYREKPQPLSVFQNKLSMMSKTTVKRELNNLFQLKAVTRKTKQVPIMKNDKETGKTRKDFYQLTEVFIEYGENIGL